MSVAVKALLDDPYFDPKLTTAQKTLLRELFNLGIDRPH